MNESEPSQRVEFLTDLASIVDGDVETLAKHGPLLRHNEAVRELRQEALGLANDVGRCGDDFEPPADLAERVLETLRARGVAVAATAGGSSPTDDDYEDDDYDYEDDDYEDANDRGGTPPPSRRGGGNGGGGQGRSKKLLVILALVATVLVAVAAAMGLGLIGPQASPPAPSEAAHATVPPARNTLTGKLSALRGDASGVTTVDGKPLAVGAELAAGQGLATDARARAGVELDDGSSLVLNHDTRLAFHATEQRVFTVDAGELLADVAPGADQPMRFETPAGSVEVTGTKLVLSVADALTSVRVARGEVRIARKGEAPLVVLAGQEGLLPANAPTSVAPMVHLASTLAWSELGPVPEEETLRGLGELRAHVPGEKEAEERPLSLAEHHVRVRIAGNVARTEVEERFVNGGDVDLEGVYRFPLPTGAQIADLALEVDGKWQRGAFVEREQGKKIWRGVIRKATPKKKRKKQEEYIWVPGPWRDPALLEWQQGGRFELRIFPIPAQGSRRVRLTYTEVIAPHGDGRRYVYPLPHAGDASTAVGDFSIEVGGPGDTLDRLQAHGYALARRSPDAGAGADDALRFASESFHPAGDLIVDVATAGEPAALRYWSFRGKATVAPGRGGSSAQARVHADDRAHVAFALRPKLPDWTEGQRRHYVLVVDASQSMFGERFERARVLAERMVGEMDRRDTFTLLACDATCQTLPDAPMSPSSQAATAASTWMKGIRPAGATDVSAALRAVRSAIEATKLADGTAVRVVYVGDGVASIGAREPAELLAQARALTAEPTTTLDTVGVGTDADALVLGGLARAGGGHFVPYVPGQHPALAAIEVLESGYGVSLTSPKITLPEGLADVAPAALPTLRDGEELVFTARVEGARVEGDVKLEGMVGGKPFTATYPVVIEPEENEATRFVARLWASQRIADLQLGAGSGATDEIVALSQAYGVMSRHTSLLVLESEAMFRAFDVDRPEARPVWTGEEEAEADEADAIESLLGKEGSTTGGAAASGARSRKARRAAKPMRAPPAAAPPAALRAEAEPADAEAKAAEIAAPRPFQLPTEDGQLMKKEWYREATVTADTATEPNFLRKVDDAVDELEASPDSRDRHRDVTRQLSALGNLERTLKVLEQWIERDALDPEALTYLSDAVGRQGQRDEALRLLTGIVDLSPDNTVLQSRLARGFERAGLAERACAHRQALAHIAPDDADALASAVRCLRALERGAEADRLLARVEDEALRASATEKAAAPAEPEKVAGDLMLEASWEGGVDVDLALITAQGTRVWWMGGRVNTVGADATSTETERLGLARVTAGRYVIEVTRTTPGQTVPVKGEIAVTALGKTEKLPFELRGDRARVGKIAVQRKMRLVPP